jgi:KaiC/GvpD/RAD55 family RecA-like ATPase
MHAAGVQRTNMVPGVAANEGSRKSATMTMARLQFGIPALDEALGGGLRAGTLTVLAGATGAGKTQLGLRWANEGRHAEGHRGILCDLTSRGDAQNHAEYARDQFDWRIRTFATDLPMVGQRVWDQSREVGDYFHPFHRAGRRVTRRDVDPEQWHEWKTELARVLRVSVDFFYSNFVRGARRVVVDGIEPTERFSDSIQFEFFEYLYHHILRKEDDWAARELFRERYRAEEANVMAHRYDHQSLGCMYLYTTPHIMLDDLMSQPIGEGDVFSNANTIILMGRIRDGAKMGRGLYVAKHRGSKCREEIIPYRLTDHGVEIL